MLIATNLKSLRKSNKLTLSELSKATDLSIASLCAYETEQYYPSVDSLLILADFYDISLDALIGRPTPNIIQKIGAK